MPFPQHPYRPLIERVCRETPSVPPDVLEAMIKVESNFNPRATSDSDARGLGQLIPRHHKDRLGKTVAAQLGKTLTDELWYDPEFSVRCAARHLRWCHQECGDWERAVAKYHSGMCNPSHDFVDGQGTSTVFHLVKLRQALRDVRADIKGGYVEPHPPPPFDGDPKTVNGTVFHPFKRRVTSTGVKRREWADPDARLTGPEIPEGEKIDVLYWVEGEAVNGNNVWLIGKSGSRIWSGGVEEPVP